MCCGHGVVAFWHCVLSVVCGVLLITVLHFFLLSLLVLIPLFGLNIVSCISFRFGLLDINCFYAFYTVASFPSSLICGGYLLSIRLDWQTKSLRI